MVATNYNPDVLSCLANLSNDEIFTPPHLANEILDLLPISIWNDKKATFLDPVSKSGVFLREIAKRLMIGLKGEITDTQERLDHILKNQIYGIAITELTSLLSRRSLYCSKAANGQYSICPSFDNEAGNIILDRIEHTWVKDKCKFCGASKDVYDRGDVFETYAYQFIHTEKPEKIFNMKFDVIIGNPPYQLSDEGFGRSASPIYHRFVQQAKKLNPRYLAMIIPARWYSGGKGLDDFREEMLTDDRLRVIHDFPEAADCFPGVQIKGGVCYFLWNKEERGLCEVNTHKHGHIISSSVRPLLEENCQTFIRYNEAIAILKKVQSHNEKSIKDKISSSKPFGLRTNFKGKSKSFPNAITLYQNGGIGYVSYDELKSNTQIVKLFKVLIPPLGSGSDSFPHPILARPMVVGPNTACTETYLVAGVFTSEKEAINLAKYLTTMFLRFLVLLNKPAQHATSKVYTFVPIQDFKEEWDDARLYKKYDLTNEEITFIESLIRPMEFANE